MKSMALPLAVFLLLTVLLVSPALAGTKYYEGSPNLTAYLSGVNEFSAGDEIQIPVVIENTGINTYKEVAADIISRDVAPNTAISVWVDLSNGSAPLLIKTDPQMIGSLTGDGTKKTVVFSAQIDQNAPAGTYELPISLNYTTFSSVDEYTSSQTFRYRYHVEEKDITVPLTIKAEVIPEVIGVSTDNLVAGAEGYVNVSIRNMGSFEGSRATVNLVQNDDSPVVPVDSSVYVGNFPVDQTVTCRYKVSIDSTAGNKSYPVDILVNYQNNDGDFVNSRVETFGVDVKNKVDFEIISSPATLSPGSEQSLQVEYKNIGESTIRSAQARISVVDPFTSTNDIAFLGDIAPGESAVATYQLSVTRDATLKDYGLDSEIRYRDALDNIYVSDPMKLSITVANIPGILGILTHPVYLSIIIAVIIAILYLVWEIRKKYRKQ
jgi:hypothetical protein